MILRQSSMGRGIVELKNRRIRADYPVTLLVITLMLGFLVGFFVAAIIIDAQNGYEVPSGGRRLEVVPAPREPREEGETYYEQRYQPA